jgi:predicted metal-dependent phosphoesterase TrpH
VIDLHLHTTASDGRCSPAEVVERAIAAGVTIMAVTDHDTTEAFADAHRVAAARGIEVIAGIEITAVEDGRDVHILGYFIDPKHTELARFLARQREDRIARVEAMGERLAHLGMPIDIRDLLARARDEHERSIGRPQIARAMVAAGHVTDSRQAFDRWLGAGRPAFLARGGAPSAVVIAIIHAAGGIASLAHPGQTAVDDRIAAYRVAGLDALEAYHPDHDKPTTERYLTVASRLGLLTSGGSDFHGDQSHGHEPGSVTLPRDAWLRLRAAAAHG